MTLDEENASLHQTIATLNESLRITSEGNFKLREQLAECERERDEIKQVEFPRKVEAVAQGWRKKLASVTKDAERYRLIATLEIWPEGLVDAFYMGKQYTDKLIDEALAKVKK